MNRGSELTDQVRMRAGDRCEYCRMYQALQGATFHVEHIAPESRGGPTQLDNLAWCCPSCNLHKSDRIDAVDPESGVLAMLFNPRQMRWDEHFRFEENRVVGMTPQGRATVAILDLNHSRRMLIRRAEERFQLFPPKP